jgi:YVTN family beta-propeller protein
VRARPGYGRIGGFAAFAAVLLGCQAGAAGLAALNDYVFVASRGSSAIAVVDTTVDEVVASVPLAAPADQYVVSEEARILVASHRQARTLSLVDLDSLKPRTLELAFEPDQIQLAPDGLTLAISGGEPGIVAIAPLPEGQILHRIRSIARPGDLMYSRDGATLFVADRTIGEIVLVDIATGTVEGRIELRDGSAPLPGVVELTRTSGGLVGFALHGAGGEVSVIDLPARAQVATVGLPGPATKGFPTGTSQHVLVPSERDRSVSLISTWSFRESARLPGAGDVSGINLGMLDSVAFVLSRDQDKALVIDLERRRQVGEIALPSRPETGVSMDAGRKLYVALSGSDRLAVIDMATRELVKMIEGVGDQPWGVSSVGALSYCH